MANYNIKLDLQKLKGAFVTKLQGKTATKMCLCIPIEEAGIYVGKQGYYLDLTALELKEPKYDDTHCVKQQMAKEVYQQMTDEEKRNTPIMGGMHPIQSRMNNATILQQVTTTAEVDNDEELPF